MTRMEKIAFKEWELQIANQKVAVSQSELIKKKEVRKGINEELINEEVRIENDKKELITKKEVRKGINEELIKEKNE